MDVSPYGCGQVQARSQLLNYTVPYLHINSHKPIHTTAWKITGRRLLTNNHNYDNVFIIIIINTSSSVTHAVDRRTRGSNTILMNYEYGTRPLWPQLSAYHCYYSDSVSLCRDP